MSAPYRVLVGLLVVALACWGSYRHGRTVEAGAQALLRQSDIVTAWHAARADVSTQALAEADRLRRSLSAARRVQEIDRAAAALPARPQCDWTPDELRLSERRWCARYADHDPARCLPTYCQPPPTRTNPRPIWERQIEDWSDQCLQLHAACADWSRRQIRNP